MITSFLLNKFILISLILSIFIMIFFLFFNPRLSVRADGTTIYSKQANFYIPSKQPLRIYVFNPFPEELKEKVEELTKNQQATFGIYIKNLSTGQEISINPDKQFTSASLYKLAVMYTIFDLGYKNVLNINQKDIQDNLKSMITISSNEAAIFLVENYASWQKVTETMHTIGLNNTSLNQVPPVTTPRDTAKLLEIISQGQAVNMETSVKMLELLASQRINDRIPTLLPPGVIVAHKTGELEDVRHDAGVLIGPDNNIVLVLMTEGSQNPEKIKPVMANIAFEIYEFFRIQWANPPEIL